jgi:predicted nucleic acid-binding protein
MAEKVLLDTDVLIDYLRDCDAAVVYLESLPEPLLVSAITVAELYSGVREGKERNILDQFMRAFDKIPIDNNIAIKAGLFRRQYGPSHGVGLADAYSDAIRHSIPKDSATGIRSIPPPPGEGINDAG